LHSLRRSPRWTHRGLASGASARGAGWRRF
jgi:hypothetical protein